jgi:heme-degrading monooxygenase HmoA
VRQVTASLGTVCDENAQAEKSMAIMISRRKLQPGEFDAWKERFEADAANRRDAGCRGIRRFRSLSDPDEIVVLFDWASREEAAKFVAAKLATRPGAANAKRPDGTSAFVNEFYEELPPLDS